MIVSMIGKIRKALSRQLGYMARDIGYLKKFMSDDIISISQPWLRPIVRGKVETLLSIICYIQERKLIIGR